MNRYFHRANDNMPGVVALALATNNAPLKFSYHADSHYLSLDSSELSDAVHAWTTDGTSFVSAVLQNHQPVGATYAYRISRLSRTSALFEVLQDGRVLGSATPTFDGMPNELFVSIYANDVDMTVRSVTIVPEPSAASMMAAAGALLLRRRRTISKR